MTTTLDATTGRRWKRYPEYKDSGITAIDAIPSHWNTLRLKWLVSKIGSSKTPRGGGEMYSESGVLFLRSQNVHFNGLRLDDVVYIDDAIDREMYSTRVLPNDVLLNITGASLGRHITLLMEYRRALISAAVTGQIDVRGEVE